MTRVFVLDDHDVVRRGLKELLEDSSDIEVVGEAGAGNPADVRADQLDSRHQRIGQDHGPQQAEAEPAAGLGIGRDAAGVVV